MKKKSILVLSWCAVAVICAVIFLFSAQPADTSSEQSSRIIDWLVRVFGVQFTDFLVRKAAHISEFAVLALVSSFAFVYSFGSVKKVWFGALFSLIYSVSDEIHQIFVPGRAGQVRDVFIDSLGIVVGVLVYLALYWLIQRIGRKRKNVSKQKSD